MNEIVLNILKDFGIKNISSIEKLNLGFNRLVYNINDLYILKICINDKESNTINEINYLSNDNSYFHTKLLKYDYSKSKYPYIYMIEEKIKGKNLFNVWDFLDEKEQEKIIVELANIMKIIHSTKEHNVNPLTNLLNKYDTYLNKLIKDNKINSEQIEYLLKLRENINKYFNDSIIGNIHDDFHFNNIIYFNGEIKIIDFECYKTSFIDKDLDSLFRMSRNPNSLIKKDYQLKVDPKKYTRIIPLLEELMPEISKQPNYKNRLLIYDCLNSINWMYRYPDYELYNDIVFNKCRKLIKK